MRIHPSEAYKQGHRGTSIITGITEFTTVQMYTVYQS